MALPSLGPGVFDAATRAPVRLGAVPVEGLRLDVWRAPTDNDNGAAWLPEERYGVRAGLARELLPGHVAAEAERVGCGPEKETLPGS